MTDQLAPARLQATASSSGASATAQFLSKQRDQAPTTDPERVSALAGELIEAARQIIRRHRVTYDEFDALKVWLIQIGLDGEWPLFLDVWLEQTVEQVANEERGGTKGSPEGPYFVPDAPRLPADATLPMRANEPGIPLLFQGRVLSTAGQPLPGATIEMWQADDAGTYSQFAPGLPEWNLRGTVVVGDDARFSIRTVEPSPYEIPTDGSCGRLITAAGWHAWRPGHLHVRVSAPGHHTLTTQLYFKGGSHVDSDIAGAVKPELILDPTPVADGPGRRVGYDLVVDPV
ncbi:catechol 1,2-dioxygenase [Streptomyces pseudovenezuelae]|uniref:catechol 1,2-dioxygenase n=1 Tax=Streptomyces pseudovenezuelae TaxID=67350 RepID=UPI0038089E63